MATANDGVQDAPDPIEHASPDVELAEAQLAVGRPGLAALGAEPVSVGDALPADSAADELEEEDEDAAEPTGGSVAVSQPHQGNRLVNFVRGSWAELQRVQWPDRRQVMQATSVVLGFVIVAGLFLGASDFVAGKLMNFILK